MTSAELQNDVAAVEQALQTEVAETTTMVTYAEEQIAAFAARQAAQRAAMQSNIQRVQGLVAKTGVEIDSWSERAKRQAESARAGEAMKEELAAAEAAAAANAARAAAAKAATAKAAALAALPVGLAAPIALGASLTISPVEIVGGKLSMPVLAPVGQLRAAQLVPPVMEEADEDAKTEAAAELEH